MFVCIVERKREREGEREEEKRELYWDILRDILAEEPGTLNALITFTREASLVS